VLNIQYIMFFLNLQCGCKILNTGTGDDDTTA